MAERRREADRREQRDERRDDQADRRAWSKQDADARRSWQRDPAAYREWRREQAAKSLALAEQSAAAAQQIIASGFVGASGPGELANGSTAVATAVAAARAAQRSGDGAGYRAARNVARDAARQVSAGARGVARATRATAKQAERALRRNAGQGDRTAINTANKAIQAARTAAENSKKAADKLDKARAGGNLRKIQAATDEAIAAAKAAATAARIAAAKTKEAHPADAPGAQGGAAIIGAQPGPLPAPAAAPWPPPPPDDCTGTAPCPPDKSCPEFPGAVCEHCEWEWVESIDPAKAKTPPDAGVSSRTLDGTGTVAPPPPPPEIDAPDSSAGVPPVERGRKRGCDELRAAAVPPPSPGFRALAAAYFGAVIASTGGSRHQSSDTHWAMSALGVSAGDADVRSAESSFGSGKAAESAAHAALTTGGLEALFNEAAAAQIALYCARLRELDPDCPTAADERLCRSWASVAAVAQGGGGGAAGGAPAAGDLSDTVRAALERELQAAFGDVAGGILTDVLMAILAGDFDDQSSATKILAQIVIGLLPVVGQIDDVRSLIAALDNLSNRREGAVRDVLLALVAIVPLVGDAIAKSARAAKRGGRAAELVESVAEHLDDAPSHAARLAKQDRRALDAAQEAIRSAEGAGASATRRTSRAGAAAPDPHGRAPRAERPRQPGSGESFAQEAPKPPPVEPPGGETPSPPRSGGSGATPPGGSPPKGPSDSPPPARPPGQPPRKPPTDGGAPAAAAPDGDPPPRPSRGGGSGKRSGGGEPEYPIIKRPRAYENAQFREGELEIHLDKHKGEYGGLGKDGYLKRAQHLLGEDVGGDILGHTRANGEVVRFNKRTGEWACGRPDGSIKTLFRPLKAGSTPLDYYLNDKVARP